MRSRIAQVAKTTYRRQPGIDRHFRHSSVRAVIRDFQQGTLHFVKEGDFQKMEASGQCHVCPLFHRGVQSVVVDQAYPVDIEIRSVV